MIKLTMIGRPTGEVVLQKSKSGNKEYVSFTLAVNEGYGDYAYTEFPECYSADYIAPRIVNAKVGPKSLIWIEGTVKTKEYDRKKKDNTPLLDELGNPVKGYNTQVRITDWGFVPIPKSNGSSDSQGNGADSVPQNDNTSDDDLPY